MITAEGEKSFISTVSSKMRLLLPYMYSPTVFNEKQVLKICAPEAFSVFTSSSAPVC